MSGPPRSLTTRLARAFAACGAEAAVYGRCIARAVPNVQQGACGTEFTALRKCANTHGKNAAKR
jgi:hypothetical protein